VFQPAVEYRVFSAPGDAGAVARSFVDEQRTETVSVPADVGREVDLHRFDERGRLVRRTDAHPGTSGELELPVEPRGFTVARTDPPEDTES
jgi:hypothetical protein